MESVNIKHDVSLVLDRVVGSQPELGPSPPDGGYGWIILIGVVIIQITIPSIVVTSGLLICYYTLKDANSNIDSQQIWFPTIFYAAWSMADVWSKTMTSVCNSCCMATTGVIFVSAGLLAASLITNNLDIVYIGLGLLAGIGASMVTTQSDFLLHKYFLCHLELVHTISRIARAVGETLMPVLIATLLSKFGLSSTLLIQAGISLQALIGALLFRKPKYLRHKQNRTAYSLLQNEETEEPKSNPDIESSSISTSEDPHNLTKPYTDAETNDENPILLEYKPEPSLDVPQPLFNEMALKESDQNVTVFIEDSEDDVELFVQRGGYTIRTIPFSHELRAFSYPMFYSGLILLVTTKISVLVFWILGPLLVKKRLDDFNLHHAMLVLCVGGIATMFCTVGCHWLPRLSARSRKITCITATFVTAGGFYLLGITSSWLILVCASVLVRLGTTAAASVFHLVLKDTMGNSDAIKTQTLLHILSGLLLVLGILGLSFNFETSFKLLGWMNLIAGILWSLQPILNRICGFHR